MRFDEDGLYIPNEQPKPIIESLILSTRQLAEIPEPVPLIPGWLFLDSLAWLGGAPGSYKSFLAMEWACHVATGTTWRGQKVKPGRVLYILAEGKGGAYKRVEAWQQANGKQAQIDWLPAAPQVGTALWESLVAHVALHPYDLIVIDTQSRVTTGKDENGAEGATVIIDQFTRLKDAAKACTLILHHMNRGGTNLRGSSAQDGAAETIVEITRVESVARVRNKKQKDGQEADDYYVRRVKSARSMTLVECEKPFDWDKKRKMSRTNDL